MKDATSSRPRLSRAARRAYRGVARLAPIRWAITRYHLRCNRDRSDRELEIGPGHGRIEGFETLDVSARWNIDYVVDASGKLPFPQGTFRVIYASHVLEHIPWYQVRKTLDEWVRVLAPGGALEVWVPNGLEICRVFVDSETTGRDATHLDGWYRFNPDRDQCTWAAGRIFTYGDGTGDPADPNWHRGLFSPRYLKKLMEEAGLVDVRLMDRSEVRGYDHGWINLGVRGTRPPRTEGAPG